MKKIMMIVALALLSGCTVSQEHANSMGALHQAGLRF